MNFNGAMSTCSKCKTKSVKNYDLPGLRFWMLINAPFICEKCLYEILTGEDVDWKDEVKSYLQGKIELK